MTSHKARVALAIAVVGALLAWYSTREPRVSPSADVVSSPAPATAPAGAPASTRAAFDFYLLALTLHAAFCADGHGRKAECRAGASRPLVIHGLWPEKLEPRAYPRNCFADGAHPPEAMRLDLEPALARELAGFMPGMRDGLHAHEWRTHGSCSGLGDDEYFRETLALARRVDAALAERLTTLAGRETSAAELRRVAEAHAPGLGATLTFHCRNLRDAPPALRGRPFLVEVRQCIDDDGARGAPRTLLDCARVQRRDQGCGAAFRIAAAPR